jgi:hypothetical protein
VLRLIKLWLKAPIEERDADGTRRMSGGKSNTRGTPQGGVASPLLANIYMNRFLKYWRLTKRGEAFSAHVVSYADDFVILSRGRCGAGSDVDEGGDDKLGLTLNEAKTSLRNARQDRFDFLGYWFGPHHYNANGKWYLGTSPSKKSRATAQDDGRQPTGARQQRSVVGSARHTEKVAARLVELLLLTERVDRSSVASTDMSMSACATSSPDGTRWQGAGQDGSPVKSSTGNADSCASNACH